MAKRSVVVKCLRENDKFQGLLIKNGWGWGSKRKAKTTQEDLLYLDLMDKRIYYGWGYEAEYLWPSDKAEVLRVLGLKKRKNRLTITATIESLR